MNEYFKALGNFFDPKKFHWKPGKVEAASPDDEPTLPLEPAPQSIAVPVDLFDSFEKHFENLGLRDQLPFPMYCQLQGMCRNYIVIAYQMGAQDGRLRCKLKP
jgi:hypothetical protein